MATPQTCEVHSVFENEINELKEDVETLKHIHNDLKWIKVISRFLIGTMVSAILIFSPGIFNLINRIDQLKAEVIKNTSTIEFIHQNINEVKKELDEVNRRIDKMQDDVSELKVDLNKHSDAG